MLDNNEGFETTVPILNEWNIVIGRRGGDRIRIEDVPEFAESFGGFWKAKVNEIRSAEEVPMYMEGDVYGRDGFPDGSRIMTSNVVSIERIEAGSRNGTRHDLLCATTRSGSRYYFYSDAYDIGMLVLLNALARMGVV